MNLNDSIVNTSPQTDCELQDVMELAYSFDDLCSNYFDSLENGFEDYEKRKPVNKIEVVEWAQELWEEYCLKNK